jgi:hypothetical protein
LRQADFLDVGVHHLGDRLVEVTGPRRAEHVLVTVVSVIIAAASAILSAIAHICLIAG